MTVERLEELKVWLQDTVAHLDLEVYYMGISVKDECQAELDDLAELIQAEIERQNVADYEEIKSMVERVLTYGSLISNPCPNYAMGRRLNLTDEETEEMAMKVSNDIDDLAFLFVEVVMKRKIK